MRLVTFAPSAPAAARVGVLDGSDVVDLTAACRSYVAKPRHRLQPVRPPAPPRQGQITRKAASSRGQPAARLGPMASHVQAGW